MSSDILLSVRKLKTRWNRTEPLIRAKRISNFVRRGISCRALAQELGVSPSLIRFYLKIDLLPDSVKSDIRSGKTSARVAEGTAKATTPVPAPVSADSTSQEVPGKNKPTTRPALTAETGADLIVEFIRDECHLCSSWGAQVSRESYKRIRDADEGAIDRMLIQSPGPIKQLILAARPAGPIPTDNIEKIDYAIRWLAQLSVWLLPRSIRNSAHTLAAKKLVAPG